ncbi:MAG: hypothetical protein M3T49_08475 [Candidatus Eremiobacteraeota bacterium]|nr:hypothetical protein [Candidatus Eremiobacteraeota bacterium]
MHRYRAALMAAALVLPAMAAAAAPPRPSALVPYDDRHWTAYDVVAPPFTAAQAPADEYFGRYKISNIGVRNIIRDLNIEGDSPLALPHQQTRIAAAGLAMVDWADKYPRDSWLPGAMVGFAKLLLAKGVSQFDETAIDLLFYASHRYAGNRYGADALRTLSAYEQTPDFVFAGPYDPSATPTPSPTPAQTAAPAATSAPAAPASPKAASSAGPVPNGSPAPTPTPSPSP